jgi:hypothetical protein
MASTAFAVKCSLKSGDEPSSTDKILDELVGAFRRGPARTIPESGRVASCGLRMDVA